MHKILRVVIDTNHIMSAILGSRGASAKLIDWMTREEDYFKLLFSPAIWDEYTTVADWLIPASRQNERADNDKAKRKKGCGAQNFGNAKN